MRYALKRHPDSLCAAVTLIEVDVARPRAGSLLLSYIVTGSIGDVLMPVPQIPVLSTSPMYNNSAPGALLERETRLYDLDADPGQLHPLQKARLAALMRSLMRAADAPAEAYTRLDFVAG